MLVLLWKAVAVGMERKNKSRRAKLNSNRQKGFYSDPDDYYFRKHFAMLVRKHGGKWIVLANGKLIGIGKRNTLRRLIRKAQSDYPKATPFLAPIPTKEDLECVL